MIAKALQVMLFGIAGIFLVMGLIIVAIGLLKILGSLKS